MLQKCEVSEADLNISFHVYVCMYVCMYVFFFYFAVCHFTFSCS